MASQEQGSCDTATAATASDGGRPTRRTRLVCISDTHNHTVKLPKGDVLIHAGDLSNMGGYSELQSTLNWLDKADFECKIVVAGNHDLTLDESFTRMVPQWFSNQAHTPEECRNLLSQTSTLTYLCHESRTIKLSSPDGPRTTFKIFASPLSPQFGIWSFMYKRELGVGVWDAIPLDTDVLVTHCPPNRLLDFVDRTEEHAGCPGLLQALWRVRPMLSVFGHIHEGRGAARIKWDLGPVPEGEGGYRIKSVAQWEDPAPDGNKQCLCDLSGKSAQGRLENDGSVGEAAKAPEPGTAQSGWVSSPAPVRGSRGIGGDPASSTSDQLALAGRLGRKETCVVNAAIMPGSYHGRTEARLNKPIVVDLELPVWEE